MMNQMQRGGLQRAGGFTLIELMIVVVIIAVLAAIAFASYQFATIKSRRSAAQACLMDNAQLMERYYTTAMTYVGGPDPAGSACALDLATFYTFDFSGDVEVRSFVLSATPTDRQNDTTCGTMTVNQAGAKTAADDAQCW